MKPLLFSFAVLTASVAWGQVPTPASEALESIGVFPDTETVNGTGQRRIIGPLTKPFRITDVSVDSRRVNTSQFACFFELWRGNDSAPTERAWSRMRIYNTYNSYDRSWVTGPQFAVGESVWIVARLTPVDAGLRTCTRSDPALAGELHYAVRGSVVK